MSPTFIKTRNCIDLIFGVLVFLAPVFNPTIAKFMFFDSFIFWRVITVLWIVSKLFVPFHFEIKKNSLLDVLILLFFGYSLVHFMLLGTTSYLHKQFWIFVNVFCSFYLFRWAFYNHKKLFLYYSLGTILVVGLFQSVLGLLQYFEIVTSKSTYFLLKGTYSSPNFFAIYLGCGFVILIWFLFVSTLQRKWIKGVLIVMAFLFFILIVLSKSRGTWLSVLGALFVLFFSSGKILDFLRKVSITKKIVLAVGIFIGIFISAKAMYALKPASVNGRSLIVKITLKEIAKKPFIGNGLYSFKAGYNKAKAIYFNEEERPWEEIKVANYVSTAFNDYLVLGYELGLLGLFLFFSILILLFFNLKTTNETRIGMALLFTIVTFSLFNTTIHRPSLLLLGVLGAAICTAFEKKRKSILTIKFLTKNFIMLLILFFSGISFYAIGKKAETKLNYRKFKKDNSIKDSLDAVGLIKLYNTMDMGSYGDGFLGYALYKKGYKKEGLFYLNKNFKETSLPKVGNRLAGFYIDSKNYKKAEEIYKFNIGNEPYRFAPKMNLINFYKKCGRKRDELKIWKEIVALPIKIPSKKVDLYKKRGDTYLKKYQNLKLADSLKGSFLPSIAIKSKIFRRQIRYEVYLPPIKYIDKKLPVLYLTDGQNYTKKRGKNKTIVEKIDALIVAGKINPIMAVFVDPREFRTRKNLRQEYFLCNKKYVNFFTKELLPIIESKYPAASNREGRTILGVSFGGLFSAFMGCQASESFKNIAMQSPAFHPCKSIYSDYRNKEKKDLKMYMSYGTGKDTEKQDLPMIKILQKKGYELKVERIENGNHNWKVWNKQMESILLYFFKKHNSK